MNEQSETSKTYPEFGFQATNKIIVNTQNAEIQVLPTTVPDVKTDPVIKYTFSVAEENEVAPGVASFLTESELLFSEANVAASKSSFLDDLSYKSKSFESTAQSLITFEVGAVEALANEALDLSKVDFRKFNTYPIEKYKLAECSNSVCSSNWKRGYIGEIATYEYGPMIIKVPENTIARSVMEPNPNIKCVNVCCPSK